MTHLSHQSIGDYLESLSSAAPTPGGGAAAALSLAQSCGLYAMALRISFTDHACSLTVPFQSTAATGEPTDIKLQELLDRLDNNKNLFLSYGDQDIQVFETVMAAYKLPRATDHEKKRRQEAIQRGLHEALNLSYAMYQLAYDSSLLGAFAVFHAKPSIVSDSAIATELLYAGAEACFYNALINSKSLKSTTPASIIDFRTQLFERYQLFKSHCLKVLDT